MTMWTTMHKTYNKIKNKNGLSGNRGRKLPYYYEHLHDAIKKDPKITPVYLASSQSITTKNLNLSAPTIKTNNSNTSNNSSSSSNTSTSSTDANKEKDNTKRKFQSETEVILEKLEKWKIDNETRETAREARIMARIESMEKLNLRKIAVLEIIEEKL